MKGDLKKKSNNHSFFEASFMYMIGNGLGQGTVLLGIIIFTRIMSQSDYGLYSTYYSMVAIVNTIIGANLFLALNTAYLDYGEKYEDFRASVLVLSTVVFIMISLMGILVNFLLGTYISLFELACILIHAYSFFVVNYYCYSCNMEDKYIRKMIFMIVPNFLQLVFSIVFIFMMQNGLYGRMIGSVIGVATCSIYAYVSMTGRKFHFEIRDSWVYALKISVPSIVASTSSIVMQQCDKVMITFFHSENETAIYSTVYYVGYILYAVLQATSSAWQAWIYKKIKENRAIEIQNMQKWYTLAMLMLTIGLFMVSPEVVKILAPAAYWRFEYLVPFILCSAFMFVNSLFNTVCYYYKKTGIESCFVLVVSVINVILNLYFVPKYGGIAAAYTTLVSYGILLVLNIGYANKLQKVYANQYVVMYVGICVCCMTVFFYTYARWMQRYAIYGFMLIVCGGYILRRKKEVMDVLRQ